MPNIYTLVDQHLDRATKSSHLGKERWGTLQKTYPCPAVLSLPGRCKTYNAGVVGLITGQGTKIPRAVEQLLSPPTLEPVSHSKGVQAPQPRCHVPQLIPLTQPNK